MLRGLVPVLFAAALACGAPPARAQHITIDGTLSPAKTLTGPNYTIGANLGRQVGANLFQSFGLFSLANGESATFTGPANVANIIGRVTGGSPSSIDGTIRSSIAGANLFLINPYGMVFGRNATVNVTGSFHASTADYLRMADGSTFQATNPNGSTFSAAAPAAFGFLTAASAAIAVDGSKLTAHGTLGLVGGPVTISGATIKAPGATIAIASAGGSGEVPLDPTQAATVSAFGPVAISGGATLAVTDSGGIFIRSGSLSIDGAAVESLSTGNTAAGEIMVQADGPVSLVDGARIAAVAAGRGSAGNVTIIADALSITGGTISSNTSATGSAGNVRVTVTGSLSVVGDPSRGVGAGIFSTANRGSTGNAGEVTVTAGQMSLSQTSEISSSTFGAGKGGNVSVTVAGSLSIVGDPSSVAATGILADTERRNTGNAGDVTVTAGQISLSQNGEISSSTFGAGGAGDVSVTVTGSLSIVGNPNSMTATGIFSNAAGKNTGNAGEVTVTADQMSIRQTGNISSGTFGTGNGGIVSVAVTGSLSIVGDPKSVAATGILSSAARGSTGNAGEIIVAAGQLSINRAGGISSDAGRGATGNAGTVRVTVGQMSLSRTSVISSSTFGVGNGGDVSATVTGSLSIVGTPGSGSVTGILSDAEPGSTGNAGEVTVNAGQLSISRTGFISSETFGAGAGGNVSVTVTDSLSIVGSRSRAGTGIFAQADRRSTGNAGEVTVRAGQLSISQRGEIASSTFGRGSGGDVRVSAGSIVLSGGQFPEITALSDGTGVAGNIAVTAANLQFLDGARISTSATSANGGNIDLRVGGLLYLQQGAIVTSVFTHSGNGGNIAIGADDLVLSDGSKIVAMAVLGHGGNIDILADAFVPEIGSVVSATSRLGVSGAVTITGEETGLNSSLVVLPSTLRSPEAILRSSCAARAARPQSTLTGAGRGGLPASPNAALPSLYLAGRAAAPVAATAPRMAASGSGADADRGCD